MSRNSQPTDEERFAAPWGATISVISIFTSALLIAVSVFGAVYTKGAGGWRWFWVAFPIGLLAGCWLFSVRGYAIGAGCLWIVRPLWRKRVPTRGLESIAYEPKAMSRSLRVFGNGGLFSFSGWFWSSRLRLFRAWVTDPQKTVVLRFAEPKRTLVLSPEDPQRFEERLRQALG